MNQLKAFAEFFGPLYWTRVHKNVRFSGFCDTICGSGLPEEEELWRWLEAQKSQPAARHHVWMMHYSLFIAEPHRTRLMDVFQATGAAMVLSGQVHCRKHRIVDGIRFEHLPQNYNYAQFQDRWTDGDGTPGFMKYDVTDAGISGAFVPLEGIAEPRGYGPGGHPPPELRDYSLAWDQNENQASYR